MSLPAWKCHRPLPDLASNAMKLPSREAAKTIPPAVAGTPAPNESWVSR